MTTPTIDFVMPYGATVEGDGTWYPKIVGDHPMKNTSSSLNLVPGPCRIAASWDGENGADVVLTTGGEVKRVAHIPAKNQRGGGGLALSWSPSEQGKGTGSSSTRKARREKLAPSRSTQCRPSSCQGGGIDDGTNGNGLDAVAGAEARIVGEQRKGRDSGRAWAERHQRYILAPRRCASADHRFRRGPLDVALPQKPQVIRHGRPPQWANGACGDGRTGANRHVRVHRNTRYAAACGRDDFPSPRLATAVAGGGR